MPATGVPINLKTAKALGRLEFIVTLGGGLLTAPLAALAQPPGKVWRIGFVGTAASGLYGAYSDALRTGLGELGFTVGENVSIEYRWLSDPLVPTPEVVADFVRTNVNVIVAYGSPAVLSAKEATKNIPIVMVGARSPVELGIIASLARPGGNITGISASASGPELAGKRLVLIKETMPQASRVGYLWSSRFPGTKPLMDEMLRAADKLRMTVSAFDVGGPDGLPRAFATMKRERVEIVSVEAALGAYRKSIVEIAAASRLPAFYGGSVFVEQGGLMSYSADWREIFRKAGAYAGKILKGAKPADLPVEQPTKYELVINLKTAGALGLTIPRSLLLRADRVIE
jgi:putative ABC transport system substrate-binding protein